jgi:hypothetical protein
VKPSVLVTLFLSATGIPRLLLCVLVTLLFSITGGFSFAAECLSFTFFEFHRHPPKVVSPFRQGVAKPLSLICKGSRPRFAVLPTLPPLVNLI